MKLYEILQNTKYEIWDFVDIKYDTPAAVVVGVVRIRPVVSTSGPNNIFVLQWFQIIRHGFLPTCLFEIVY